MAMPVLVRDAFCTRNWFVYVPADNSDTYWTRYTLSPPTSAVVLYAYIKQIMYGIVRPGITLVRGVTGWNEYNATGTAIEWFTTTTQGWNLYSTATIGEYILATIPSGYNAIQIAFYNVAGNGATCNITWDDDSTTGLDVTSYNTGGAGSGVIFVNVAANSGADGIKRLKIIQTQNGVNLRVVGVRAFNTSAIGDPSTASGGLATGHDIVADMAIVIALTNTGGSQSETTLDPLTMRLTRGTSLSATDFAVATGPDGGTLKLTGSAHYTTGGAPLYYHSGEYTSGPMINIDGTDVNQMYDATNNPCRKLRTGNQIKISFTGFIDWDEGGAADEDATEPDMSVIFTFTQSGFEATCAITFNANSDIHSSQTYSVMYPLNTSRVAGSLRILSELTKYNLTADRSISGNDCEFLITGLNLVIRLIGIGVIAKAYYTQSTAKGYVVLNPVAAGNGLNPVSGDVWSWSGRIEVFNYGVKPSVRLQPSEVATLFAAGIGLPLLSELDDVEKTFSRTLRRR